MRISNKLIVIFSFVLLLVGLFVRPSSVLAFTGEKNFQQPAREYLRMERDFIAKYVLDKDGGFSFWVDRDGTVQDHRKYAIFQSNVILFIGGIHSQYPEEVNVGLIRHAADYLLANLYSGQGWWYEVYDPETKFKRPYFWNPPSEAYIADALFVAYQVTGDVRYKEAALETTERERLLSKDGHIFAETGAKEDIGYKFAQHAGQFHEYLLDGNQDALVFTRLFDRAYRGVYARETIETIEDTTTYLHGTAVVDKLLYALLDQNEDAYVEAHNLHQIYRTMGHDDYKVFDTDNLGETADNGRDYYDKSLAMDLLEWTYTGDEFYQQNAIALWKQVLRFWDTKSPFGFLINLKQMRKTCFSINQPAMLMDITPPKIVEVVDEQKSLWNHQLMVTVQDPHYAWNYHNLRGIGVNPKSYGLEVRNGLSYGIKEVIPGPCENCYRLLGNYLAFGSGNLDVTIADLYDNTYFQRVPFESPVSFTKWGNLNRSSILYYLAVFGVLWGVFVVVVIICTHLLHRSKED